VKLIAKKLSEMVKTTQNLSKSHPTLSPVWMKMGVELLRRGIPVIFFFVPDFGITFSGFTFLGELLITFWLLIKGVNVEEWKKRALESA
jgi:hypothetical protein